MKTGWMRWALAALAISGCEAARDSSSETSSVSATDGTDGAQSDGSVDRAPGIGGAVDASDVGDGRDGNGDSTDATDGSGDGSADSTDGGDGGDYSYDGSDGYDAYDGGSYYDGSDATDGYDAYDGYDGSGAIDATDGGAPWVGGDDASATDGTDGAVPGGNFEDVGVNPFVIASADPLSTFAIDVDTASYDIFRQYANQGSLPPAESVRLEEYVNAFEYGYAGPPAGDEVPFAVHVAGGPSLIDTGVTLVRVGIQARRMEDLPKKDRNLVFLVDTSGSMGGSGAGSKLGLVKTTLNAAVDVLDPNDTVSIVTYAGDVGVALPSTSAADKSAIKNVISGLGAGGGTAGAAGIDLAYAEAEKGFIEGGINHVVLCTDGDFNVGLSGTAALEALIEEKRKTGITLTVLGVGMDNLNDEMMEKISNAGNGTYAVITDSDDAVLYGTTRLTSDMTFVAQDVKIQVTFNQDVVLAWRLLGYENRAIADEDFTDDTVDAGEIGAGHDVTALYEVVHIGGTIPLAESYPPDETPTPMTEITEFADGELVRVTVRYKEPGASETTPAMSTETGLTVDGLATAYSLLDEATRWAAAVATLAELLRGSPYAAEFVAAAVVKGELQSFAGNDAKRLELAAYYEDLFYLVLNLKN